MVAENAGHGMISTVNRKAHYARWYLARVAGNTWKRNGISLKCNDTCS